MENTNKREQSLSGEKRGLLLGETMLHISSPGYLFPISETRNLDLLVVKRLWRAGWLTLEWQGFTPIQHTGQTVKKLTTPSRVSLLDVNGDDARTQKTTLQSMVL